MKDSPTADVNGGQKTKESSLASDDSGERSNEAQATEGEASRTLGGQSNETADGKVSVFKRRISKLVIFARPMSPWNS